MEPPDVGRSLVYFMYGSNIRAAGTGLIYNGSGIDYRPGWDVAGVADFNGDGKDDILWRHRVTGVNHVYYMNGSTSDPAIAWESDIADPAGLATGDAKTDARWRVAGVGDLDHDGYADIVWRHATSGKDQAYLMYGNAVREARTIDSMIDLRWKIVPGP